MQFVSINEIHEKFYLYRVYVAEGVTQYKMKTDMIVVGDKRKIMRIYD